MRLRVNIEVRNDKLKSLHFFGGDWFESDSTTDLLKSLYNSLKTAYAKIAAPHDRHPPRHD